MTVETKNLRKEGKKELKVSIWYRYSNLYRIMMMKMTRKTMMMRRMTMPTLTIRQVMMRLRRRMKMKKSRTRLVAR